MIKIIVTNMSCGHCQIKITAELEENNFKVIKIDMNKNSVLLDAKSSDINKIKRILDNINYVVDDQNPIMDIVEFTVWNAKLDDEKNYDLFTDYLINRNIKVVGFNNDNFGVIILCTEIEFDEAVRYISEL